MTPLPDALFVAGGDPAQAATLAWQLVLGRRTSASCTGFDTVSRAALTWVTTRLRRLAWKTSAHPGLWYEINHEAIELTVRYRAEDLPGRRRLEERYNRYFRTDKLPVFFDQRVGNEILCILADLHLCRLHAEQAVPLLVPDTPIHRFVLRHFMERYRPAFEVRWVRSLAGALRFAQYWVWLGRQLLRRGITLRRPTERFLFCKEAIDGFDGKVLRDDLIVDDERVHAADVLYLARPEDPSRANVARACAAKGYRWVDEDRLPIPFASDGAHFLGFYAWGALVDCWRAGSAEAALHMLAFRRECLAVDLLTALHRIETFLSHKDWGEVPQTIVANRRGTRVVIWQWSDNASYRALPHGFTAHNLHLFWGPLCYEPYRDRMRVDKPVFIGCAYKAAIREGLRTRDALRRSLRLEAGPVATFFDTSFNDVSQYDEEFLLRYLTLVRDFAAARPRVQVLLKPKRAWPYEPMLSPGARDAFRGLWRSLTTLPNFRDLRDWSEGPEGAIAVADVVVSMGMNTPSLLALLCGVEALYYDDTGNVYHPLARRYKGSLVFDQPAALTAQLDAVLEGRFSAVKTVDPELLAGFDAGRDDDALRRLRAAVELPRESSRPIPGSPAPA